MHPKIRIEQLLISTLTSLSPEFLWETYDILMPSQGNFDAVVHSRAYIEELLSLALSLSLPHPTHPICPCYFSCLQQILLEFPYMPLLPFLMRTELHFCVDCIFLRKALQLQPTAGGNYNPSKTLMWSHYPCQGLIRPVSNLGD